RTGDAKAVVRPLGLALVHLIQLLQVSDYLTGSAGVGTIHIDVGKAIVRAHRCQHIAISDSSVLVVLDLASIVHVVSKLIIEEYLGIKSLELGIYSKSSLVFRKR